MKKNKTLRLLLIAILFSVVYSIIFKTFQTGEPKGKETLIYGFIIFFNIVILGGLGYYFFGRLITRPPSELRKKLVPYYLLFVVTALFISLTLVSLGVFAGYLTMGIELDYFWENLFRYELPSALKQFAIWILLGSAVFFYITWRSSLDREQALLSENLKFRYRNLKTKVNPHFLFNSLNTLSELIHEDTGRADKYIAKLSSIYRYVLENEDKDLVKLEEELRFVEDYFSLQSERDRDKIFLKTKIEDPDPYLVIPASVQSLVENALKHNTRSKESPLIITIEKEGNELLIRNPLQRKNILENKSGIGLTGLKERVNLILHQELKINEGKDIFEVRLPVKEK
jgi:hypothetical protein